MNDLPPPGYWIDAPYGPDKALAPTDGDNRYKAVQAKLEILGRALDDAGLDLEELLRSIKKNAKRAEDAARDVDNAELDPKFVELTSNVSVALGGAGVQVEKLHDTAQETANLTHETKRTHSKLYGALDDIRSGRREKTPRPGFFNR
ncbi:conjugal transfer protein TraB [Streptomyces sp. NPDC002755]|uniref:conjugal transfer protein TraB n=1 Tax=Streptomyces sp. NPDC002884 TaxID=3154544 RepID=UPI00331F8541